MSVKHTLHNLVESKGITLHYSCDIKGNGFGYGNGESRVVFFIYSYPFWYYYRITDTPTTLAPFRRDGVRYMGVDALQAGDMIYRNSMFIYRALKSHQIYSNKFNVKDELLKLYFYKDDPVSVASTIGTSFPDLYVWSKNRAVSVYDHLECIHILLMYRMLNDFKELPEGQLEPLLKAYVRKDDRFSEYIKRISTLVELSKEDPYSKLKMSGEDRDLVQTLLQKPHTKSRRAPRKRNIEESLNSLMERMLRS